ncbi:virulence RhuM family protein [Proteiniphilum acetatigenes]|uniref:virulence RhuM family protein n=1 Tax=Proteiniphilum acetatigenes TaxID=294710 RepID=UPI0004769ED8|nr:RhuM family protein [Proteiniphilum acetatigenes]
MEQHGEIILYQPDETVKLEVRLEDETVWLTQAQIVELFQSSKANISGHIKNIYEQQELEENTTVRDFRTVRLEGKRQVVRKLTYYNLDAIISIGFRVNSKRGILFRQWANKILKEYMLKGYAINQRIDKLERTVAEHGEKIDFFVRTSLPPVEGVFYNGQIFDAYVFATNLIKSAKKSLILIDNYVDESVLLMLAKRNPGVTGTIYTGKVSGGLLLDLQKHNTQYPEIIIREYKQAHDRFLIVDGTDVYHLGASLKDLGKKLFAFSRLDIDAGIIIPNSKN